MDKRTKKQIEWAFYHYVEMKQMGAERIFELAETGITACYDRVGGRGEQVSTPTESKALKAVSESEKPIKWCKVFESTLRYFQKEREHTNVRKDELLNLRYMNRMKEKDICYRLNIERETMYRWIKEILNYACMVSIELRLITLNLEE